MFIIALINSLRQNFTGATVVDFATRFVNLHQTQHRANQQSTRDTYNEASYNV